MSKKIDSLHQLHSHAMDELHNRDGRITLPEKELLELREKILDDSMDDVLLDNQTGQLKKQLIKERDMLLVKIETLSEEIESLRGASESKLLSELKSKLAHSEQKREELEKDRLHHSQQGKGNGSSSYATGKNLQTVGGSHQVQGQGGSFAAMEQLLL